MQRASLAFGILLSSVVLLDCGAKMLGPDDLGTEASPAVNAFNSIVTPQHTNNVTLGEARGHFNVTSSGQASYTVPLWTPDGPMGMAPSLTLRYDSSAGSGPLGVGFALTGNVISKISRCQKTIDVDNEAGPIEWNGTTYCLDGKRLVPLSSASPEYRTREDDGSKILRIGPDYSPQGWTVYLRNGQILTYGVSTGARLTATIKSTACPDASCNQIFNGPTTNGTLTWALEKITDRVAQIPGAVTNGIGNYITIAYATWASDQNYNIPAAAPKYGSDFVFKEMLISDIYYSYGSSGTTPRRRINFTYGQSRADARYSFVSGMPIMSTRLLTRIGLHAPNPTSTQHIRTYEFQYETGEVSQRARLKRIFECDAASPLICKKPTVFTWEEGSNNFLDVVDSTARSYAPGANLTVLDYNADGKTDLVFRGAPNIDGISWFQFLTSQMGAETAQGTTTTTPVRVEPSHFAADAQNWILGLQPLDLDGDARSDIALNTGISLDDDGTPGPQAFNLYRNRGNGFVQLPQPSGPGYDTAQDLLMRPMFPDMDGDGLPEQVQVGLLKMRDPRFPSLEDGFSQLVFRHNQGAGVLGQRTPLTETGSFRSFTVQSKVQYLSIDSNGFRIPFDGYDEYAIDFDGSGRAALLIRDSFFNTNQVPPYTNVTSVNNQMRYVHLSRTGAVSSNLLSLASASRDGGGGRHYLWLDVNGDRLPDPIDVLNAGTSTYNGLPPISDETVNGIPDIRINTGAGFKKYIASLTANPGTQYAVNARADAGVHIADMNQDGLDDVVLMGYAVRNGVTDRSKVKVLAASTGTTATNHLVPGPVLRSLNNGQEIDAVLPGNTLSPVAGALGDFNGDGLTDMVLMRSNGVLHFYIRQGKKADQIKQIDTGTGRHLEIEYRPASDPVVYSRMRTGEPIPGAATGPWEQPSECSHPKNCVTGGLWVVSRYVMTNDQKVNVGHTMRYAEGRASRDNWLGFAERIDYDDINGVIEATTYDNRTPGTSERYPFAHLPAQQIRITRDNGAQPGTYEPHRFITTNHYQEVNNLFTPSAYSARLADTVELDEILEGVHPSLGIEQIVFDTGYASEKIANATTTFTYDQLDNIKTEKRVNAMGEILEKVYTPVSDTTQWLLNRVSQLVETSTTRFGEQVSRTRAYSYYPGTLLLNTEMIQNGGTADVRSVITYTRGANALGQVTEKKITATSTVDDISVAPGTTLTRTETTTYDAVDGVTVASITNPLNQRTLYAYHGGHGVLAQSEDPNGVIRTYQYDTFGRIRKRTVPTAGEFTMSYEAPPTFPTLISSIVSALGPAYAEHAKQIGGEETIITYNMNGKELVRQTKAGDGAYRYVLTRYKPTPGQVASVSMPFGASESVLRQTSYTYDNLGRKTEIRQPDASTHSYFYTPRFGPLGYLTTITDELGHVHEEARNDDGQVESVTEFLGGGASATTTYGYGPFGVLKSVNPPSVLSSDGSKMKAADMSYTYDVLGRRVQENNPDAGPSVLSYNAFGDVVAEKDPLGAYPTTFYKRDGLGRVTEKQTYDGTNTYEWDTALRGTGPGRAIGKLKTSRSFDGTTVTHTYDTNARPDVTTWNVQGRNYSIKQSYVVGTGQVGQIDYPTTGTTGSTQLKVTYLYDAAGGISTVKPTVGTPIYWRATRWGADGRIDQENDRTGMVTTRTFDNNRRWVNSIRTAAGSTVIQDVTYGHDLAGNVTSRNDAAASSITAEKNTSETFNYDETNKLRSWTFDSSAGSWMTGYFPGPSGTIDQGKTGPGATSLNYDYYGNAMTQLPHAVRSINAKTLVYDGKGRQTSTFSNLAAAYTSFGLPARVADHGNPVDSDGDPWIDPAAPEATYKYDAQNNRVFKTYNGNKTTASIAGLYERRVSRTGVVSHVMYIRGPGKRVVAQETWTESGSSVTTSPVLYHHDDIVGSTVVTNTTNTTSGVTRLRYDPFGQRMSPINPTVTPAGLPTRIGFTGHEMDDEFKLINMKGRIYDPKVARFLSPDPLVSAPHHGNGYDRYGYALNNPMKYTDPSGFAIGTDPWLMMGYGEGFLDIYAAYIGGMLFQAERRANEKAAAERAAAAPRTREPTPEEKRGKRLADALESRDNLYLDDEYVQEVDPSEAPPAVGAFARTWEKNYGNRARQTKDKEIGSTMVRKPDGGLDQRWAKDSESTSTSAAIWKYPTDTAIQINHSHLDGTSAYPSNQDLRASIFMGMVPVGTLHVGLNRINIMWWVRTPQGMSPRQTFIPLKPPGGN